MNPRHLLPAFVLVTLSSCLQAEFLTSLEIGYNEQTFHPSLVGPGGTGDYKDVGRGPEVAALAGYELDLADWFSIAGIARGAYTSAEWEYTLSAEPATFRYAIPFTLGLGVQPRLVIAEPFSIFLEGGVQWGYIEQQKNGPLTDGYDVNQWRFGYVLGGGVEVDIEDWIAVRFNFRHVWYDSYDFQSVTALGAPIWNVSDAPQANSLSLAAVLRF